MKKSFLIAASLCALAACTDNTADNAAAATENAASNMGAMAEDTVAAGGAMMGATENTASAYATNAALGDMYEIESSKLAASKAQSAEVKKFAAMMVTDHTMTTEKLKAALTQANLNVAPPAALDERRQRMITELQGVSGAEFDRLYLDQQTMAHQEALTLHSGFAENGDNDVLKKLAAETTPKIQHHFDMVKQLDNNGADGTN
jgi:putative membrane protein